MKLKEVKICCSPAVAKDGFVHRTSDTQSHTDARDNLEISCEYSVCSSEPTLQLSVFNSCPNSWQAKIGTFTKWYGFFSIQCIYIYYIHYICPDFAYFLLFSHDVRSVDFFFILSFYTSFHNGTSSNLSRKVRVTVYRGDTYRAVNL